MQKADVSYKGKIDTAKAKAMAKKETNPKDAMGIQKAGMQCVSCAFIYHMAELAGGFHNLPWRSLVEVALAMTEGARKYGRHNYRVSGVRASVYYDAMFRHLVFQWWNGEDIDKDSGICHITKATACMAVFLDAIHTGMWVDDRPPQIKLPSVAFHNVNPDPNSASWQFDSIISNTMQWWEGGEHQHLMDASYNLLVLRDHINKGTLVDDRPQTHSKCDWLPFMHDAVKALIRKYPNSLEPFTEAGGTGCDDCQVENCGQRTDGDTSKCGRWIKRDKKIDPTTGAEHKYSRSCKLCTVAIGLCPSPGIAKTTRTGCPNWSDA